MPSSWYKTFMAAHDIDVGSRKPVKSKPVPIPTLGQLAKSEPRWVWLNCINPTQTCWHKAAMPLAPLIIRWGANASSNILRQRARCSQCGTKGTRLLHPSVDSMGSDVGSTWQPFPVEDRALCCREV